MKSISKFLLSALIVFSLVAPVSAAQWYISGWVNYNDPSMACNPQQHICQTAIDSVLGPAWNAEDGTVRNIVARVTTHNWALMQVGVYDYQPLVGHSNIDLLPDFPFDAKMTAMTPATRNNLDAILAKWGIPSSCSGNADGYRDFIRCVGRQIQPDWAETSWGN